MSEPQPLAAAAPDLGYLFVLAYGRSGSTLIQGVLSSIPGYLIRGENNGAMFRLYQFHRQVMNRRKLQARLARERQERSAWFGIDGYTPALALPAIRELMLTTLIRPEPDSRVVGYKEIRYQHAGLAGYIAFMRRVFPGARFVFNTRDHAEVAQSKWWAETPDALEQIAAFESRMLAVKDSLEDAAFHIHYNDYVEDVEALRPLFTWLGEEYDEQRLRSVLEVRHSF